MSTEPWVCDWCGDEANTQIDGVAYCPVHFKAALRDGEVLARPPTVTWRRS